MCIFNILLAIILSPVFFPLRILSYAFSLLLHNHNCRFFWCMQFHSLQQLECFCLTIPLNLSNWDLISFCLFGLYLLLFTVLGVQSSHGGTAGLMESPQCQDAGLIPSQHLALPQLRHRLQPWVRSDPWSGNSVCHRAAKNEKKKEKLSTKKLKIHNNSFKIITDLLHVDK